MKITQPFLIFTFILALGLRLVSLDQSLWLDEAINVRAATNYTPLYLITNYSLGDFHPPIFHLILHYWILIWDSSEVWVRLPSLIFGLVTIYYLYGLSRKLLGKEAMTLYGKKLDYALIPPFLLATSGLHVYYSQEARMYSFAAMATMMSIYYAYQFTTDKDIWSPAKYLKHLKSQTQKLKTKNSIMLIISLWLLLMSDYVAYFVLPVIGILAPIPLLIALLLAGWWLPLFWLQLNQGLGTATDYPLWGQVVGGLSLKNILLIPIKFMIGRINIQPQWLYGLSMAVMGILTLIPISLGLKSMWASRRELRKITIISWLIIPFVIGIGLATQVSLLSYFRFLFVLPAFYLFIAVGLKKLPLKLSQVVLTLIILMNLTSTAVYLTQPQFQREDWRGFSAWVDAQETKALTVFPNLAQADPYLYYQTQVPAVESLAQLEDLPESIYLVRYVQEIFDPEDKLRVEIEQLGYVKVEQLYFNKVLVWHYQPQSRVFANRSAQ